MPNSYHKGVNSLKSHLGFLVVARLIRSFRQPNILFKKYLPFHAVQTCHAFPVCIFVGLQELKSFLLCKKTAPYTFHYTFVFFWC